MYDSMKENLGEVFLDTPLYKTLEIIEDALSHGFEFYVENNDIMYKEKEI